MRHLLILSCLFAVCLIAHGQSRPSSTARPATSTGRGGLACVCSCCSGLTCKPIPLRSFADATCTAKACKEKCKVFEPKHCDHSFFGNNESFCTV